MGLKERPEDGAHEGHGPGDPSAARHGRAALLRLASWFEEADPDRADALAAAAYGLHASLHLGGRVDDTVAATTSWWQAEPDRSPVTERPGTRPPEPVRDHRAQRARLRDAAESSAHWRRAGAAQVRSLLTEPTGARASLDLSGAGMEVLMELLTAALGAGDASHRPTSAGDLEFSLRLHVVSAPGAEVTILGEGGELTLEGLRLCVTPYDQHTVELPALPDPLTEPVAEESAESRGGPASPEPSESQELSEPRDTTVAQDPSGSPEARTPQVTRTDQEPAESQEDPGPRETSGSGDAAVPPDAPRGTAQPLTATELLTSLLPGDTAAARPDRDAADADTGPLPVVTPQTRDGDPAAPADTPRPDDAGAEPPRGGAPHSRADANPDNETTGPIDLSAHRRDAH